MGRDIGNVREDKTRMDVDTMKANMQGMNLVKADMDIVKADVQG